MATKKKEIVPMVRVNTRIRPEQKLYIKKLAKKKKKTEGEIFRGIMDGIY